MIHNEGARPTATDYKMNLAPITLEEATDREREVLEKAKAAVGFIATPDAEALQAAGYTEQHILGVMLALSVKILSNYANHLFQTKVDDVFAAHTWQPSVGKVA